VLGKPTEDSRRQAGLRECALRNRRNGDGRRWSKPSGNAVDNGVS